MLWAFTNQIVVQPFLDGTFRYLSNTIEQNIVPKWEDAYKEIVRNMESYLADPYVLRQELDQANSDICIGYIGIHDFNDDGVSELMIGDGVSIGIFTYDDGMAKKIADLYEPEVWGGINGVHYRENMIILVNSGSDGSCYVCISYYDGEYVTGVYDEYHPQTAVVNGKEDGIVTALVIDAFQKEDEYILIEDLDFGTIKW